MTGRICKNCGAEVPPVERNCPSCGRLIIDSAADRLGARIDADEPEVSSQPPERSAAQADEPPAKTAKPKEGEGGTDSYYAIAPDSNNLMKYTCSKCGNDWVAPLRNSGHCPRCGGPPKRECGPCSCALFFIIIFSTMLQIMVYLLL